MAKKKIESGATCLNLGRALSRAECGLAIAARGIMAGNANDLRIGISTVRDNIGYVEFLFPGWATAKKIESKANSMNRILEKKRKISREESKKMLNALRKMKGDVDQLFVAGASECPSGERRTR